LEKDQQFLDVLTGVPTQVVSVGTESSPFDRIIDEIPKIPDEYQKDIAFRHKTGCVINAQLGSPARRQKYGRGVLDKLARRMSLSPVEIQAMRRFAAMFPDMEVFAREYPECVFWHDAKIIMRARSQKERGVVAEPRPDKTLTNALRKFRAAMNAIEQIQPSELTTEEQNQLFKSVNSLVIEVTYVCLKRESEESDLVGTTV
jgi:hypothetical protein